MYFQQPSEIPGPQETRPDQVFGEYSLWHFLQDNWLSLFGVLLIIAIVIGYAQHKKRERRKQEEEKA